MSDLISKGAIYKKIAEMEDLARKRVLDTPTNSPCYMRYVAQLNERTAFKHMIADEPTIEAEPVVHGWWEWFEEWSPSTTEHPRECDDCGWRCSRCKTALEDMMGGYWDNPDEEPKLNYCPNCGAKMDRGEL